MLILALDPSTTRTGYAVMSAADKIVDAGYLAPRRTRDDVEARIDAMVDGLAELCEEHWPRSIIIEVPSGRPGAGSKAGAQGRLAIYGMAVGELRRAAKELVDWHARAPRGEPGVVSVNEREWTRGRTKVQRQALIAQQFKAYAQHVARDRGGDVADAIGIGQWWFTRGRLR